MGRQEPSTCSRRGPRPHRESNRRERHCMLAQGNWVAPSIAHGAFDTAHRRKPGSGQPCCGAAAMAFRSSCLRFGRAGTYGCPHPRASTAARQSGPPPGPLAARQSRSSPGPLDHPRASTTTRRTRSAPRTTAARRFHPTPGPLAPSRACTIPCPIPLRDGFTGEY